MTDARPIDATRGPAKDGIRFHPDVATDEVVMGWMVDEHSKIRRGHVPAVITGKPLSLGGIPGRSSATSDGAFHAIRELEEQLVGDPPHVLDRRRPRGAVTDRHLHPGARAAP